MLRRRTVLKSVGAGLALAALGARPRRALAAEATWKLGTLAPKASPWGKALETWVKAVADKSGGRLELQVFYNGQQGDEGAMIGKLKAGSLDGALVTGVGLGKAYKPILALQLPGLFTSWAKLDKARDALKGELEKGLADAGYVAGGWIDVGLLRAMAKGFAVTLPDVLKGKKPCVLRDDALWPAVLSAIGGVTAVPLNTPEVLPNLNTGAVNAIHAPCLLAEQLQWTGKLDNLTSAPIATIIGATLYSKARLGALPEGLRTILVDTGKVAAAAMTTKIRAEDDAAFTRVKARMTVTDLSPDQATKWSAVYLQARQKLAQGMFSADLVAKLEGYAR